MTYHQDRIPTVFDVRKTLFAVRSCVRDSGLFAVLLFAVRRCSQLNGVFAVRRLSVLFAVRSFVRMLFVVFAVVFAPLVLFAVVFANVLSVCQSRVERFVRCSLFAG